MKLQEICRTSKNNAMKEPKVNVGIMFEPQIDFILQGNYLWKGTLLNGCQTAIYSEGKILWNGSVYEELLFETY